MLPLASMVSLCLINQFMMTFVVSRSAQDDIVAQSTVEGVVADVAHQGVVVGAAVDKVAFLAGRGCVLLE